MAELTALLLKKHFQTQGSELLQRPNDIRACLENICPTPRAQRLLLNVFEAQFPQRLSEIARLDTHFLQQLSQTISNHLNITHELALWAVQVWGFALGKTPFLSTDETVFIRTEETLRQLIQETKAIGELTESLETKIREAQKNFFFSADEARQIFKEVRDEKTVFTPEPLERFLLSNQWGMAFTWLEPGVFSRGSAHSEAGHQEEETLHQVTLSLPFCLQTTPITQAQWKAIMGYNPSDFKGDSLPVENISWQEITEEFLPQINSYGDGFYRLPTEAEWEFAARAGSLSAYYFGNDDDLLSLYCWHQTNSDSQTHPIAEKEPNPWGFYDMYGNVLEWCHDWFQAYIGDTLIDPLGPEEGAGRVVRGGCWFSDSKDCRSAARSFLPADTRISLVGFRLVKVIED